MPAEIRIARETVELSVFGHYLRTGQRLDVDECLAFFERKYNHNHDERGRFATGSGATGGASNESVVRTLSSNYGTGHADIRSVPRPRSGSTPSRLPTRKEIIASGTGRGQISIRDNPHANASAPIHEVHEFEQVTRNDSFIRRSAQRHGVDPDLVRAIAYVESTHGYYDAFLSPFDANKSILPMNVNTAYWGNAWGSRESLRDPAKNIEAGTRILRSIQLAMPSASVAKIATIYNDSNAVMVNSYGARVQAVYRAKLWQQKVQPIPTLK